jgi:hypothetical protein
MTDCDDRLPAARQDLGLLVGELAAVCGQLEELATMWRRQCVARNSWREIPHAFPQGLREGADRLADTLRALVETGDLAPDPVFFAVAQLSALDAGIAAAADAVIGEADRRTQLGATILATMGRVRTRQWSLIGHLAEGQRMAAERAAQGSRPQRADGSRCSTY